MATPFVRTTAILTLWLGAGAAGAQQPTPPAGEVPSALTTPNEVPPLPPGIWQESPLVSRVAEEFERRIAPVSRPRDGFFIEFGNAITGAGFPMAGPGYRHHLFNGAALFSASGMVSSWLYTAAQARLEFRHLADDRVTVGGQSTYQDSVRVNYFGLGADSDLAARSGYRLQAFDTSAFLAVDLRPFVLTARVGSLAGVQVGTMAGFDVDYPDTVSAFTDATAPGLDHQPAYLYSEVAVASDRRNEPGHPTRGGLYQVNWAHYADRDEEHHTFDRFELSATQYLAGTENWVLGMRGFSALSRIPDGNTLPFYLAPSLGGKTTLRGYRDYRFHDNQMAMGSIESRWAVLKHLDLALFAEVGTVGRTLGDLWGNDLKSSIGTGVRYHSDRFMIGRAEIAHSPEGWRVIFLMTEPLQRSRPSAGSTSMVPFVP